MKKKITVTVAVILLCIVICTALYYCGRTSIRANIPKVFLTDIITKTGGFGGSIL